MQVLRSVLVLCLFASGAHAQLGLLGVDASTTTRPVVSPSVASLVAASRPAAPPYAEIEERRARLADWISRTGIQPRASWSSEFCPRQAMDHDWDYDTVVIHHSGNYAITDPVAILRMHIQRNRWSDIGYHFLIRPDGTILEGRSLLYKGSHVRNANAQKIGVIILGNFQPSILNLGRADPITPQAQAAAVRLVRSLRRLFPSVRRLGGHRDFIVDPAETRRDCPGDNLYRLLPQLRAAIRMRGA